MPIRIDSHQDDKPFEKVAWLGDDDWELPSQIYILEEWLKENHQRLTNGPYVADIGFSIREDASGGGGVLSVETMKMLVSINMEIWFSEYPGSDEDDE